MGVEAEGLGSDRCDASERDDELVELTIRIPNRIRWKIERRRRKRDFAEFAGLLVTRAIMDIEHNLRALEDGSDFDGSCCADSID